MTEEKVIYMGWIAYQLIQRGYPIKRTEINPNKPEYNCYVFDVTPGFMEAFIEISNSRKSQ